MELSDIFDVIRTIHPGLPNSVLVTYQTMRPPAEKRASEIASRPPRTSKEKEEAYCIGDILRATEALSYVWFILRRTPIDGREESADEFFPIFKPSKTPPTSMHFGLNAGSTSSEAPGQLQLPLGRADYLVIQRSLRRKFPGMIPWLRSDDELGG